MSLGVGGIAAVGATVVSVAALVVGSVALSRSGGSGNGSIAGLSAKASACWAKADASGSRHCATGKWRHVNIPSVRP